MLNAVSRELCESTLVSQITAARIAAAAAAKSLHPWRFQPRPDTVTQSWWQHMRLVNSVRIIRCLRSWRHSTWLTIDGNYRFVSCSNDIDKNVIAQISMRKCHNSESLNAKLRIANKRNVNVKFWARLPEIIVLNMRHLNKQSLSAYMDSDFSEWHNLFHYSELVHRWTNQMNGKKMEDANWTLPV